MFASISGLPPGNEPAQFSGMAQGRGRRWREVVAGPRFPTGSLARYGHGIRSGDGTGVVWTSPVRHRPITESGVGYAGVSMAAPTIATCCLCPQCGSRA